MKTFFYMVFAAVALLTGCATIISEQSRKLVDTDVKFSRLRESPESYIGKHVMLGGRIAGVRNSIDGSRIEIVQFSLDDNGIPEESMVSNGRFLATSSDYLDDMIFQKGMLITLVGEIKGKITLRLDDMDYSYPVIAIRELHLVQGAPDRAYLNPPPYQQYNPYFYGYGYEPFWPRHNGLIIRPR